MPGSASGSEGDETSRDGGHVAGRSVGRSANDTMQTNAVSKVGVIVDINGFRSFA
jgi:hypothetical protein